MEDLKMEVQALQEDPAPLEEQMLTEPEIDPEEVRKAQYRGLRRQAHIQGGALLGYQMVMTEAVTMVAVFAMTYKLTLRILEGGMAPDFFDMMDIVSEAMMDFMGIGYLLAVFVGWLVLRLWKKKAFFKNEIYKKNASIRPGTLMALICIVFGLQIPAQLLYLVMEWLFNLIGLSMERVMDTAQVNTNDPTMWLYVCIAGPITEELIFRGFMMRSLEPYGKKFAVLTSAIIFGLFHGSPIQTPYAFLVGLVLGYVAMEYNIIWAMVLHILNNMLLGDLLPRMLSFLPLSTADAIIWIMLGVCALIAVVILVVKRKSVGQWNADERLESWQTKAFWRSPLVIILTISCLINLLTYFLLMLIV